ncbi:peroxiredoxin [Ulvibacter antarcticus]|uniref:thioredoxin-dependent peroxiredoxin n=1 Tax=Ulvibacter antarcticus TaxID=442714 RepID=A0A3L9YCK2_9FLAO|nr:peroxiredoxin [Ulvibacter antarcticus]RMA58463.1 peroxiredoxin Q/BCP [Ulvibacter antarcticus]
MSLKKGQMLPKFSLKDQNGNLFSSESIRTKQPIVIFFYPKNFTPGCVKEVCSFRDNYQDFTDAGAVVIGISGDSEGSHKKFETRFDLPFTLLADTEAKVRKLFGVKSSFLGLLPGRETFVFDRSGKLFFRFQSLNAQPHIDMALEQLQLQIEK